MPLCRRLEALGAQLVVDLGLGDDQHRRGYEGALEPWLRRLWSSLPEFHLPVLAVHEPGEACRPPIWAVHAHHSPTPVSFQ